MYGQGKSAARCGNGKTINKDRQDGQDEGIFDF
jgi:hypothetical protein